MEKIIPVERLFVTVIPGERKPESRRVDPDVFQMYERNGYGDLPLTRKEANKRGINKVNGLMSSFTSIRFYPDNVVAVDIMATRYFLRQAVADIAKFLGDEEAIKRSIDMANVSLLAPTIYKGQPVLIAQVKGNIVPAKDKQETALGTGEIHAAMAAGNVNAKYLEYDNPLLKTLQEETSEEIGLDLSDLNPSSFCFVVMGERMTGQVNFAAVASHVDFEKVIAAYQASIAGKPLDKLEVGGLAIIPIRNAASIRDSIEIFEPDGKGNGEWKNQKRGLRPYTEAVIEWLADTANQESLIQKAGI